MQKPYSIGIDIGGTKISGCVLDDNNNLIFKTEVLTPQTHNQNVINLVLRICGDMISKTKKENISGIGISTGGNVDHITGTIISATNSIPEWAGTSLGYILRKSLSLPLFVENDGNMAVYGEWKFGKFDNLDNIVGITIGTGLGGGIISERKILRSGNNSIANFGQIKVRSFIQNIDNQNDLEFYLSGKGLMNISQIIFPNYFDLPKSIMDHYSKKDPNAQLILKYFFEYLEFLLNLIQSILSPQIVILGGGVVAKNLAIFKGETEKIQNLYPFIISCSELNNNAGMIGAAIYAKDQLRTSE